MRVIVALLAFITSSLAWAGYDVHIWSMSVILPARQIAYVERPLSITHYISNRDNRTALPVCAGRGPVCQGA